jgi:hypothetical protein
MLVGGGIKMRWVPSLFKTPPGSSKIVMHDGQRRRLISQPGRKQRSPQLAPMGWNA